MNSMAPNKIKDIAAFSGLYDKYAPALYGVILKLTPDVQLAGEVIEKSFKKIWKAYHGHNASKRMTFGLMLRITLQQYSEEAGVAKHGLTLLMPKRTLQMLN